MCRTGFVVVTKGMVERMMREIVRTCFNAILDIIGVGRANGHSILLIVTGTGLALIRWSSALGWGRCLQRWRPHKEDDWTVETPDPASVEAHMDQRVTVQKEQSQEVLEKVRPNRVRVRTSASKGTLPSFEVGEYVMVTRVKQARRAEKYFEQVDGTLRCGVRDW